MKDKIEKTLEESSNEKFNNQVNEYVNEMIRNIIDQYFGKGHSDVIEENLKLKYICKDLLREKYPNIKSVNIMGITFTLHEDEENENRE